MDPFVIRGRRSGSSSPRVFRYARSGPVVASDFDPLSYGSPLVVAWAEDPDWTHPADGAAVASWPNRGSLSGDFVQAVGAKQPIYDVDAAGGKPGIVFTSADSEVLTAGGAWGVAAADQTVVAVAKVPSGATTPAYVLLSLKSDVTEYLIASANNFPEAWLLGSPNGSVTPSPSDATALSVIEIRCPAVGNEGAAVNGGTLDWTGSVDLPQAFDMVTLGGVDGLLYGDCTVAFVGVYPTAAPPDGLVAGLMTHYSI